MDDKAKIVKQVVGGVAEVFNDMAEYFEMINKNKFGKNNLGK